MNFRNLTRATWSEEPSSLYFNLERTILYLRLPEEVVSFELYSLAAQFKPVQWIIFWRFSDVNRVLNLARKAHGFVLHLFCIWQTPKTEMSASTNISIFVLILFYIFPQLCIGACSATLIDVRAFYMDFRTFASLNL